jgi:hypothetical protein
MSGIKGGKIPEISLSYLIISENRYLQDITKINNQIFVKNCGDDVDFKSSLLGDSR